jgi:hypothetical protein
MAAAARDATSDIVIPMLDRLLDSADAVTHASSV